VVLCKTLKFFCKVLQTLGGSTEQRLFSGFEGGPTACLLFLFIYQGELGGFMQNFQVFLVKLCQDCVEVRNREGFGILRAIESLTVPESGEELIPRLIAEVLSKRTGKFFS
jgi:hypothetical protein